MIQVVIPYWLNPRGYVAMKAFSEGLHNTGIVHKIVSLRDAQPSKDPMICWGIFKKKLKDRVRIRQLQDEQKALGDLVIIERGFVKREDYYMVGWNSINGAAEYPHSEWKDIPTDRWDMLGVELAKRQTNGCDVLVIGQVPWDTTCQHISMQEWVEETCQRLAAQRIGPVVFRPHPLQPNAIKTRHLKIDSVDIGRPIEEALRYARTVVTFCSNVGVDALIAGVPTTCDDPMSMIWGAGFQNRERWAAGIAYSQWSLAEFAKGLPWKCLYEVD